MKFSNNNSYTVKFFRQKLALALSALLLANGTLSASEETGGIKLYALNCGTLEMFDAGNFSSAGQFDGQKAELVDPCFLIRHPKGDLLWDTGLSQSIADMPNGELETWGHKTVAVKLSDQLEQLGLTPKDIEFLSLSHYHGDHSGNANLFATSTFIANLAEHEFMFSKAMRAQAVAFAPYAALENSNTVLFETEHDVFGDGTAVIKSMPGHTPGHSVLMLRLERTGTILLTGDLYIMKASRALKAVPSFNSDKIATLQSMKLFEALATREKARVIIQHEKSDFRSLPPFPAFLD